MSDENTKSLEAVTRMIELTQQGKLEWTTEAPVRTRNVENNTTPIFYTTYRDRMLRLYKVRIDVGRSGYSGFSERPASQEKIVLEFVNENGYALWMFPEMSALQDLLTAVKYQLAGVSNFLDEILSE